MLFREDNVARADADAIRKGVGFYRWTHDIVEITGKDALEVLQKIYISNISKVAVGRSKYTASLDENGGRWSVLGLRPLWTTFATVD